MCCCWQLVRQLRQSLLEGTLDTRRVSPPPPFPFQLLLLSSVSASSFSFYCSILSSSSSSSQTASLIQSKENLKILRPRNPWCHKLSSIHDVVVTFWCQTFQANVICLWFPSQRETLNKFWTLSEKLTLARRREGPSWSEILSVRACGIAHASTGYLSIQVSVSGIAGIRVPNDLCRPTFLIPLTLLHFQHCWCIWTS